MELPDAPDMSRRELMRYLGVAGASAYLANSAASWASTSKGAQLIARAAKTKAHGSDLGAVEHIIFLMQENRSYDHYFGAYPRGRGFDDHAKNSLGAFAQNYPGGSALVPKNKLLPFHLDSKAGLECTDDLTHDWGPMHLCWNHGKMDSWVKTHTSATYEGPHGTMTMGYYERADLPFHWALADEFTLCDAYHCSILGPTNPNRLMAQTGTIDPSGKHGGPVIAHEHQRRHDVELHLADDARGARGPWRDVEVLQPEQRRRERQVRRPQEVPDVRPDDLQPDAEPAHDGHDRPCAPVLQRVPQSEQRAVQEGVRADVPQRLRRRHQVRQAAERVVDHPGARVRRAPVGVADERPVLHLARARRAASEREGVVEDRAVPDVRRERRLVRPCPAPDRPRGAPRAST